MELADLSQFQFRDPDPALEPRIAQAVEIYVAANSPRIPSLVLPKGVLAGHIPDAKTLIELLVKHGPIVRPVPASQSTA